MTDHSTTLRGLSPAEQARFPDARCVVVVDGEESVPVSEATARRMMSGDSLTPEEERLLAGRVAVDRQTVADALRLVLGTRGGPPFLRAALAWREFGGEILMTTTSGKGPGATEAQSPGRIAVIAAERATTDRLTIPPDDLVDLIVTRIERQR